MKRTTWHFVVGAALFAAATLAACGGGGSASLPTANAPNPAQAQAGSPSGLSLKLVIPRDVQRNRTGANSKGSRRPTYVSTYALGLQLSVTVPATNVTQTIYVDLQADSPLCSGSSSQYNAPIGSEETCTVPLPVLGAKETLTGTEVNEVPTGANLGTGLGTGFAAGAYILAMGSATVNTGGFSNTVALGLGPVVATLVDCDGCDNTNYGPPPPDPQNFSDDDSGNQPRLVVTAGLASTGSIGVQFQDADCGWYDAMASPAPNFTPVPPDFTDVNGSPEPITYAASTSAITLGIWPAAGGTPTSYSQAGQIVTDADYQYDTSFLFNVNVAALPTPSALPVGNPTPQAIVFSNNLTATPPPPFRGPNGAATYATALSYAVVPIWAYPSAVTTSVNNNVTVTGFDYGAVSTGMSAESAYGQQDDACTDTSNGNDDALVTSVSIASNGLAQINVNGQNAGTCTFVLYDPNTGVVTLPVTVTVTP